MWGATLDNMGCFGDSTGQGGPSLVKHGQHRRQGQCANLEESDCGAVAHAEQEESDEDGDGCPQPIQFPVLGLGTALIQVQLWTGGGGQCVSPMGSRSLPVQSFGNDGTPRAEGPSVPTRSTLLGQLSWISALCHPSVPPGPGCGRPYSQTGCLDLVNDSLSVPALSTKGVGQHQRL